MVRLKKHKIRIVLPFKVMDVGHILAVTDHFRNHVDLPVEHLEEAESSREGAVRWLKGAFGIETTIKDWKVTMTTTDCTYVRLILDIDNRNWSGTRYSLLPTRLLKEGIIAA